MIKVCYIAKLQMKVIYWKFLRQGFSNRTLSIFTFMSPPCHFLLLGLNTSVTLMIKTNRLSYSDIKRLDHFIKVTLYLFIVITLHLSTKS